MEFFNFFLIGLIFVNFMNIGSYKGYKDKVNIIIDNAEKINATNEQIVNTKALAEIKKVVGNTEVVDHFKKAKEYNDISTIIEDIKKFLTEIGREQYAWDKTISETNKVPHELNIIELGKLEYQIKDKAKALTKKSVIFNKQILTGWSVIIISIFVLILLNFFRDKNLIPNN